MRRVVLFALILVLVGSSIVFSQDGDDVQEPAGNFQWGVGLRFPPSVIAYTFPYSADPALISALITQVWIEDKFGVEAGGWMYKSKDNWSESFTRVLSAGALYKLSNRDLIDFILAARGVSYLSKTTSQGYDCQPPLPVEPTEPLKASDNDADIAVPPYCGPVYQVKSRSLTMAGMATGGFEWQPVPEISLGLEFGVVYSQLISENNYPNGGPVPPIPVDEPRPIVPPPPPGSETFSSSQLGVVVSLSVLYRF